MHPVAAKDMADPLKICLAASAGGHLSQLLKVARCTNGHDVSIVTTSEAVRTNLAKIGRVHVVGECNREHPLRVVGVLFRCIGIVFRERPHVIISTGAAPGCICCFLAKLLGAKVVWVDSITNVERISLSGRMIRPVADLFLVQWPELAEKYHGVEYVGAII
jgi:UDP-N-acetylglucosamine:LPS N-acetylglucosamine transferase